jgi:hypothetical protein
VKLGRASRRLAGRVHGWWGCMQRTKQTLQGCARRRSKQDGRAVYIGAGSGDSSTLFFVECHIYPGRAAQEVSGCMTILQLSMPHLFHRAHLHRTRAWRPWYIETY